MTKRELKFIIKECVSEVMENEFEGPEQPLDQSPDLEQNPEEVTFAVTGPNGEGSFTLSKEVATSLMLSLKGALGDGESEGEGEMEAGNDMEAGGMESGEEEEEEHEIEAEGMKMPKAMPKNRLTKSTLPPLTPSQKQRSKKNK